MAKIYRVIRVKLNQLISENVHMITDSSAKRIDQVSTITVSNISPEFVPRRWWQKLTGIDMEQNYVTVTLCTV